ncbi:MAG TPA: hypothetical protein DCM05_12035 [Elusimicrobia bacterium]|nr:hypothetical protein [Elusimicrobiota bacterium]
MKNEPNDLVRGKSEQDDKEKKGGAGLVSSASGSASGSLPGSAAVAARQVQPWMLKVAHLKGGVHNGIELLYPKTLAGQALKLMGSKIGVGMVVGSLAVSSGMGFFDMNQRGGFGRVLPVGQKVALFQDSARSDRISLRGEAPAQGSSSLALAAQRNKIFAEPAAAPAKEQASAGAGDPGAAQGTADAAAAAAPDPAAALAASQNQSAASAKLADAGYGKFTKRGEMNSQLTGGAGYSGGIGKAFAKPSLSNSALAQAKAFANPKTGKVTRAAVPAGTGKPLSLKGQNARRLERMHRAMGPTRGGNVETGSAIHTQEWSNARPPGNSIDGYGERSAVGISNGGINNPEGTSDGGPTDTNDSSALPANSDTPNAPAVGGTSNVTPWQQLVDTATALLAISAILTLLAYIVVTGGMGVGGWTIPLGEAIAWVAAAMAGIAAMMGVMIMAQGQMIQGAIFTATGAMAAYYAWSSIISDPECAYSDHLVYSLASNVGGMVAGQLAKKMAE